MARILVSGLINIETTLKIDHFPLNYFPVTYPFYGVSSTVSGVGFNLAKALTTLGNEVRFSSLIGNDIFEEIIRKELAESGISDQFVLSQIPQTAQSVILYDGQGRRQIHTDLKDLQDHNYPPDLFLQASNNCDLFVLCNVNFSRPFLSSLKTRHSLIATDVHAIGNIEDEYNQDFMNMANILFMSHENLTVPPVDWIHTLWERFSNDVIVIGMGEQGAFLGIRDEGYIGHFPAVQVCPVVNTIGAGDALFSAFLSAYLKSHNPYTAIQEAILFASYKIGATGAAEGFLNNEELEILFRQYKYKIQPNIY